MSAPEPPPPAPPTSLMPWLRGLVLLVGSVAGTLLVRALDAGLSGQARPLGGAHVLFGVLLAAAVSPGALLSLFIGPDSGERARGLAFGGCVVTMFTAVLGGAFLWQRGVRPTDGGSLASWAGLLWCAVALPVAAADAWRVRHGAGDADAADGDAVP